MSNNACIAPPNLRDNFTLIKLGQRIMENRDKNVQYQELYSFAENVKFEELYKKRQN